MANTIVGLEITEEGVRAAEVTTGKTPTVIAYAAVPLPPEAAKDSEVFDRDAVVLAIRQVWSRAGIKGKNVVLGLGSRRILVRDYTTQAMRPDLLAQALPYQVQDLLPVPADQAVLDFYPVSQEGGQVTGLLVAAVAETVEDLVATVGRAKVDVQVVDLAPFALARAASRVASAGETVAALHLGDHTSYVVVVQDGVPRFVRIIPVDIATAAVRARENAAVVETDAEAAPVLEDILETVPPANDGDVPLRRRSAARSAVRPASGMTSGAIDDLVLRLGSTLRFYADRSADAPVTRVLVSGAGAAVDGIPAALAATLPMPVEVLAASGVFAFKTAIASADDDLNLLTTAGLALGRQLMALAAAHALTVGGAPRVNLLPRAIIERRERSSLIRKWGWGLAGALGVVVLATGGAFALQLGAQQRLATENARTLDLLGQVAALQPVNQKLQLESELTDFRTQAMGTDLKWAGVLDTVRSALPDDVGIIEYALTPGGLPQGDDPTAETGAQGTISFTSGTSADIVGLIRSVRGLPGVIDADGWANTLSGSEYRYDLRVTFDQSVYTGAYAEEAAQ